MKMLGDLRDDLNRFRDDIDERFDGVDAKLKSFDDRFAEQDKRDAEIRGMSRVAMWFGSGALLVAGSVGTWLVQNGSTIVKSIMAVK